MSRNDHKYYLPHFSDGSRAAKGCHGLRDPSINSLILNHLRVDLPQPGDQVGPLTWSARAQRVQGASASWAGWGSESAKRLVRRLEAKTRGDKGPKASGTCGGGAGQSSWRKSARSQRRVSGRRAQGGARSMCASTRRWKAKAPSLRRRGATCARRREACGCCQAHSNCGQKRGPQDRPGRTASPSPSSRQPSLLPYPKGGHGGREAVHDKHHLPGEENDSAACEPPAPFWVLPNPLAKVLCQSYQREESSQTASSLHHEALPAS